MSRQRSLSWIARHLDRGIRIFRGARWALEGVRDQRRLEERFPGLRHSWHASAPQIASDLSPVYRAYITTISSPRMAISLRLATLLALICALTRPHRILDIGSGFSSFVFRRYQAVSGERVEVWSVDHSAYWLEHTRAFLAAQGLSAARLETWDAFAAREPSPHDVVFYDIGRGRSRLLPIALSLCAPSGFLILDDFQIFRYRNFVLKSLRATPHAFFSLHAYTADRYRRYAALITDLQV